MLLFQDVRMASVAGHLPDSLVLEIFLRLPHATVLNAGLTCRQWFAVSRDEFLWRELFYSYYRIPRAVPRHPGTPAWQSMPNEHSTNRILHLGLLVIETIFIIITSILMNTVRFYDLGAVYKKKKKKCTHFGAQCTKLFTYMDICIKIIYTDCPKSHHYIKGFIAIRDEYLYTQ